MTQRSFRTIACVVCILAMGAAAIRPAAAATLTVTNTNDSGAGSLRAAMAAAGAGDVIVFSARGTIGLTSVIPVTTAVTISGPGADQLAISGSFIARIFEVTSNAIISGLTLKQGFADSTALRGGAIKNTGTLTLDGVAFRENVAFDGGGALYNESASASTGQLVILNSELSGNFVSDPSGIGGGALLSASITGNAASVTIVNSTITGNSVSENQNPRDMAGGGIYFANSALRLFNSTVAANRAGIAGGDIHQASVANTSLTLRNSIVSGGLVDFVGVAPTDIDLFQPGSATIGSLGYNIVTNRSAATGYNALTDAPNGTNPLLGALTAYGGPTQTMLPPALSPATAFVPLASCLGDSGAALTRDQRGYFRQASGMTACDAGATEGLALTAVMSRKFHGGLPYDVPITPTIPLAGPVNVEPRGIGAGHLLVFQFNGTITSLGTPAVAPIGSVSAVKSNNEVLVTLTSVPDNRRVTVSLAGANGLLSLYSTSLGFLVGDVNGNRAVNASDISAVKARMGPLITNANFKFDLNASGDITNTDVSAVKARSGLVLP